jgi:hypothetical protein
MDRANKKIKRALKRKKKLEERVARTKRFAVNQENYAELIGQLEEVNRRLSQYEAGFFEDEGYES